MVNKGLSVNAWEKVTPRPASRVPCPPPPLVLPPQLCLLNSFAHKLPKSEFDVRTLVLLKHLAAAAAKLERDRIAELGVAAAAEQEVIAGRINAAIAAAGGAGDGGDYCSRRGSMSGMEVLWKCVQDDAPGDERWVEGGGHGGGICRGGGVASG